MADSYSEFVQKVRRYKPSQLIPAIAQLSSSRPLIQTSNDEWKQATPWALAAMARESILYGNEFRPNSVNTTTIDELFDAFGQVSASQAEPTLNTILTPLAHEQFPHQESVFEEIARSQALFGQSVPSIDPFPWEEVIGLPLDAAIGASLMIASLASAHGGRFETSWLQQDGLDELFDRFVPKRYVEATASLLTGTPSAARHALPPGGIPWSQRRFAFNPLWTKPLVDLGSAGTWTPLPTAIPRAITPANLYYAGMKSTQSGFAEDLGTRVEAYVGRQLRSARGLQVYPEVVFDSREGEQKSADWFLIADEAVVVIEVKSARMTLAAKAAGPAQQTIVERSITHGRDQIDKTARLIRAGHDAFQHIPNDRRIIGLVVTAEPFYLANSRLPEYGPHREVPTLVASLREIEHMVAVPPSNEIVPALLEIIDDPEQSTWALSTSLQRRFPAAKRNKVLDEAWAQFSWLGPSFWANTGAIPPVRNVVRPDETHLLIN
ncbi:hypothetical protein QN345_10980 [Cryobacterium sp. 10I1]|nr:hypothetical protein [Cryobacterium sp. 10I1]MEB0305826.1 hypothetical protein [Cryobacterium sp. 10I1]